MAVSKKFTITGIQALKPGEYVWDTRTRGLGVRCLKEKKIYVLKYRFHGRQRYYTIGTFGDDLTPEQARNEAGKLWEMIRKDIDPAAQKKTARTLPLVRDAFTLWLEEIKAKRSKRTYDGYRWLYENAIKKPLGGFRVDAVARADIARLHSRMKDTPYQANRLLAVLSSFFSWCIMHGHRTDGMNPCRHIEKYKEKSRERFLSEEELFNLGKALERYEQDNRFLKTTKKDKTEEDEQENPVVPYIAAAIRLLILTGARSREILTLKWEDVDFERRLIRLQESKTGQKTIYLSAPALQLLSEIPRIEGNPYVICGKKEGAHLVNIKDPWREIRTNAGLPDVRVHDLRHNYASTAVAAGHHLKVIGSLLGHADTQTTERYAHLANDPLQTANEVISNRILQAMTGNGNRDNVVPFSG